MDAGDIHKTKKTNMKSPQSPYHPYQNKIAIKTIMKRKLFTHCYVIFSFFLSSPAPAIHRKLMSFLISLACVWHKNENGRENVNNTKKKILITVKTEKSAIV